MSTIVQLRGIFLPDEVQNRIQHLLNKLFRKHTKLQKVTASIQRDEKNWFKVLITAKQPGKQFVVEGAKPQLYSAVVDCVQRLNRVMRKQKEKVLGMRRAR